MKELDGENFKENFKVFDKLQIKFHLDASNSNQSIDIRKADKNRTELLDQFFLERWLDLI